jgi:2-oxoisovalerate dehydrogenase E1 component
MSINRAEIVDKNFTKKVSGGLLPPAMRYISLTESGLRSDELVDLFESQIISRHLDFTARLLKARNESYYTIGSSGHEGNAIFGKAFRLDDMAFLHYRSGAFFVQRSKQLPGSTPAYDMLLSLCASSEDPISQGRHKVFGSVPLFVPPQTSTIASHLPKAVGMALSIRRARDLGIKSKVPHDSVVVCNFGDASHNHASAQTAFNAAGWAAFQNVPVPIVFICEDNGIGISVPTPHGWIEKASNARASIKYFQCDGKNLLDSWRVACEAERYTRQTRKPAFIHMSTVRLLGHAGSDIESLYNSMSLIEAAEADDPLLHSARLVIENGILSKEEVLNLYESTRQRINRAAEHAISRPRFTTSADVMKSVVAPRVKQRRDIEPATDNERETLFGSDWRYFEKPQHMAKLINWALADLMLTRKNVILFGEDIAGKGGVYNVTTGLLQKFGARRIFNTLLDETSILGMAIGAAHNGFIPIPEIQFLAYVHNAEDQIRGEAATLSFFSSGQYTNPMVIRIAGLAYQKGFGGHFHNDNSLAVFRDIPGVIIACPSNGTDAARMLRGSVRAAEEEGRVVVFIEPIALYMTKDLHETGDNGWCFDYPNPKEEITPGECAVFGDGTDLAIITYGNGYYLSRQAEKILNDKHGMKIRVIDLRWLAPIDYQKLADNVKDCRRILIVDECRKTGSLSEGLVTALVEHLEIVPKMARVTAEDCYIPLGKAYDVLLPSKEKIVEAALALCQTKSLPKVPVVESKRGGLT